MPCVYVYFHVLNSSLCLPCFLKNTQVFVSSQHLSLNIMSKSISLSASWTSPTGYPTGTFIYFFLSSMLFCFLALINISTINVKSQSRNLGTSPILQQNLGPSKPTCGYQGCWVFKLSLKHLSKHLPFPIFTTLCLGFPLGL